MKRILTLIAVLLMALTLTACQLYTHDSKEDVLEYALIATDASDFEVLEQYPNLKYLDLRGSTCFEDILAYAAAHPDLHVRYTIDLGPLPLNHDVKELRITDNEIPYEDLLRDLTNFHSLKSVHFEEIYITKAQLDELVATYPQIAFTYTINVGDKTYDPTLTELNLSKLSSQDFDQIAEVLDFMPNLTSVDLMDASGKTSVTLQDAKKLVQAYPQLDFNYQFRLFGQVLNTKSKSLNYKNINIGDTGLAQIQDALAVMPDCTIVSLDNCSVSDEAMSKFRDEHPDKKIVWRIFVDSYSVMTDAEVILMRNTVTTNEATPLKYCTNVKYLDMTGCKINDFRFLANMPNLECVVLQLTQVSDLSPLQNCQNLTWLDLTNCSAVSDVSPLSNLKNLKYLNLSATRVKELSPLDSLPLERFKCAKTSIKPAELSDFQAKHPNCAVSTIGSLVGKGWRFEDTKQKEPFEYYAKMCEIFGY